MGRYQLFEIDTISIFLTAIPMISAICSIF